MRERFLAAPPLPGAGGTAVLVLRTTWFGSFLMEGDRVVASAPFPKDAREVARRLELLRAGEVLPEEKRLAARGDPLRVTERRQLKLGSMAPPESQPPDLGAHAAQLGFTAELRRDAFFQLARASVASARGRDLAVVQAVRAYEELLESGNRLSERLRESYGLHFPELARLIPTERYARLVAQGRPRGEVMPELGLDASETAGGPLEAEDGAAIQRLAELVARVEDEQASYARSVEQAARAAAPNLSALLGPMLAARLLESAGSLAKLSRMPASTVQLLGAERALFRHLRDGSRPPKHGVLFLHASVHSAPAWARGKLARALASKAAIAARADAYGPSKDIGPRLREAYERRRDDVLRGGPPRREARGAGSGPRAAPAGRRAGTPGRRRPAGRR